MDKKFKYVKAKVYDTQAENFVFPEDQLPELQNKDSLGITFSGGGTRSASLTLGQLRALNQLGVLQRAKYMCGVSGGSWGTLPFVYLPENINDETFLGKYLEPNQITEQNLKETPPQSMAQAISNAKIIKDLISSILEGHDLYSRIISRIFLEPFGIGAAFKFFTYNKNTRNQILKQNHGSQLTEDDFYLVNKSDNRPFYIAPGILQEYSYVSAASKTEGILAPKYIERYQFEMTPLYVGINKFYKGNKTFPNNIGGGYVQPHGFNTEAPDTFDIETQIAQMKLGGRNNIFNLGEIIGTSGAAPAVKSWITNIIQDLIPNLPIFPDFDYWCNFDNPLKAKTKSYDFADGGGLENLGIMPLLKRGVKKIIIFSNCETPITGGNQEKGEITDSIPALFYPLKDNYGQKNFDKNVVFANQIEKYNTLVSALLQKQQNDEPTIHIDTYTVTKQDFYGIEGGYDVKIMWVYNSLPGNWTKQLDKQISENITNGVYGHFPYYKTFEENPPQIIELTAEQVNIESQLSSWILMSNADLINEFLK